MTIKKKINYLIYNITAKLSQAWKVLTDPTPYPQDGKVNEKKNKEVAIVGDKVEFHIEIPQEKRLSDKLKSIKKEKLSSWFNTMGFGAIYD